MTNTPAGGRPLKIAEAARRVRRSRRTIRDWINSGDLTVVVVETQHGRTRTTTSFVDEQQLLAVYRARLASRNSRGT